MKFAIVLLSIFLAVSAKTRVPRLPQSLMQSRPEFAVTIDEKIVGGHEVEPNSIPYQLSMQTGSGFHFCGASLLDQRTALTAAHCCLQRPTWVVAGDHNLKKQEGFEQKVKVAQKIRHPSYSSNSFGNDICILKLAESLQLNDKIQPVQLPSPNSSSSTKAVVSGWGTLSIGGSLPSVLYSVEVPIVSDKECNQDYSGKIEDSMICAGAEGIDSCQGDSGGPLVCDGAQCGIVSWGRGCALAGYPGVYTEVSYFLEFINKHLNE